MTDAVQYSVADGIARIHLNRPKASNALNSELADGFERAVNDLAAEENARVLVLSGGGKNFCAGGDVRQMAAASDMPAFLTDLAGTIHRALVVLDGVPVPVVAAVQGSAAGAGLGLVLAADFVVAGSSSTYTAAYSAVGLSPDCGVSALLPGVVGLRRAAKILLDGKVLTADEALDWGLVSEVVPDDDIVSRADQLAGRLARGTFPAIGQTRRLMRAAGTRSYADHLDDEAATIARVSESHDAVTRIATFAAR
ncbi:enoyl-CoA hydratase/isomerase family protein [Rhodococcoides kyotonense]|uniref:2-(1,2-epoxy-1,2-dihydrophenyl)acetyl-CoA isomerase n=1 Tax=Rhodococcoides kyotonense TaxID=398843 RepID=A0A239IU37_9NOCA|nr:enoyl-CoA hydratase-related protein [Rhodococcus kyotonensis]SNS97296.1 2-(1,2-epoxy-1,2-dihydrophenyl)acetyl-CoA isomerase [Rhodococcus kyotonensis]